MSDTITNLETKLENLTEQDFGLISQANDEFTSKRYTNCLQTLNQLEQSMGCNGKLSQNKAVVEFYKNDCKDYKLLLNYLDQELKEAQKEELKENNLNTTCFNKAVILYHLRQPHAALDILHSIVEKLDDLDRPLSKRASLLMLSLLLETSKNKRAFKFLQKIEKHFGIVPEPILNEENLPTENKSDLNSFERMFKILSILTNLVNGRNVIITDDGSIEITALKAHQYYIGKDFQMAAKQLSKKLTSQSFSILTHGEDQDVFLANNMGVIHLRVRHYAMAAKFFQFAINFDNKICKDIKESQLHEIGGSKKPEILYNLGIAMLHLQRPKEAFDCFLVSLKIFHNNPRLWLRLAESCIMVHEKNLKDCEKSHIVSSVIGSGMHRKYVLEPSAKAYKPCEGHTFAIPNPNLEFAALCLRNAVSLIELYNKRYFTKTSEQSSKDDSNDSDEYNFCHPSTPILKDSFDRLLAAIYTAYSYVSIRLGDFTIALEYGKMLLQLENLSDANAMLGHLYCAESLIMLNRVTEARTYLEPNFITNLNSQDFETRDWQINSIEAAQSVLRYNLVVTLLLQGEFDLAKACLATCTHPVVFTKYKMLKMYIELAAGNIDNCKIMINIDTPQFR